MIKISPAQKALFLSTVALLSAMSVAQAGFQWKGSLEPNAYETDTEEVPAKTAAPVDLFNTNMPVEKVEHVEAIPVGGMPPLPAPEETGVDIVNGFGSDISLPIALQQIAPHGFRYSFGKGVNPGTRVSWQGGKSWQQVLADTLARVNLTYKLIDGSISVIPSTQNEPVPAAPIAETIETLPESLQAPIVLAPAASPAEKVQSAPAGTEPDLTPLPIIDVPAPAADLATVDVPVIEVTPPIMPNASAPAAEQWQINKGQTLKEALTAWSQASGITLYWSINFDYKLNRDIAFEGSFTDAVRQVLDQFAAVDPRPYGEFHKKDGFGVLIIRAYDPSLRRL